MGNYNYKLTDLFGRYDNISQVNPNLSKIDETRNYLNRIYIKAMTDISQKLNYELPNLNLDDYEIVLSKYHNFLSKVFIPESGYAPTKFGEILRLANHLFHVFRYFKYDGICTIDEYDVYTDVVESWNKFRKLLLYCLSYSEVFDIFNIRKSKYFGLLDHKMDDEPIPDMFYKTEDGDVKIKFDDNYFKLFSDIISRIISVFIIGNPVFNYIRDSYKLSRLGAISMQIHHILYYDEIYDPKESLSVI